MKRRPRVIMSGTNFLACTATVMAVHDNSGGSGILHQLVNLGSIAHVVVNGNFTCSLVYTT